MDSPGLLLLPLRSTRDMTPHRRDPSWVLTVSTVLPGVALPAFTDVALLRLQAATRVLAWVGEAGAGHTGPTCGEGGG